MADRNATQYSLLYLKALYFPIRGRSTQIEVPTLANGTERFPVVEAIMKKTENVEVKRVLVLDQVGERSVEIFFRHSKSFDTNAAVKVSWAEFNWPGDLLVIQVGQSVDYVNLTSLNFGLTAVKVFLKRAIDTIAEAEAQGDGVASFARELTLQDDDEL
ncbi:hypothetical protein NLJ89_g4172 [Agrocybe chaxingu]|uniref:Uncharacterized protein n=1 Tax=Agrocybe chaxingu TaxID=84603 RepID=A0A9W8K3K9_9AGAR|nr:hypothetical protein NLJ89_g4172 [Agrocybe chaxingu]